MVWHWSIGISGQILGTHTMCVRQHGNLSQGKFHTDKQYHKMNAFINHIELGTYLESILLHLWGDGHASRSCLLYVERAGGVGKRPSAEVNKGASS